MQQETIYVLVVEDSESDAKLAVHELRTGGQKVDFVRVQDALSMRSALSSQPWDVVLSDWGMPRFNALAALELTKALSPETPFIIVSGTIGEEAAVQAMRAGASDYVPKSRMGPRLRAVVERELRERDDRRALRHAREALLASETRMARLSASGIVGIAVLDLDHQTVSDVNDAFLRMIGSERQAFEDRPLSWQALGMSIGADDQQSAIDALRSKGSLPLHEQRWRKANGEWTDVLVGLAMLNNASAIACVADQTERRRAEEALRQTEEQLRQAQKMEAIGNLAGGIAHDFNNLLTVILSQVDLLTLDIEVDSPIAHGLDQIQRAATRASDLTRRLLAFGRRQMMRPQVVRLEDVVEGLQGMLVRVLGEHIDFTIAPRSDTGYVRVDPAQLEHVIMNLVINARDAMPQGGQLTIDIRRIDVTQESLDVPTNPAPGRYVVLAVRDTGMGMNEETRSRIFEPFFTTKGPGQGTGLGLSMAFGIVDQSGGHIRVQSEEGVGSTFEVYLPSVAAASATASSSTESRPLFMGHETVLLAEDDDQVRRLMRRVLEGAGYTVLEAKDGSEALQVAEQHQGPIHLLCTDVIMPHMGGREVADRLQLQRPEMKILFVSGYPGSEMVKHGVAEQREAFLSKPLTPSSILRRLRQVLDEPNKT